MKCTDCCFYKEMTHFNFCALKYKNPVTNKKITRPLTALQARSVLWGCGSSGSFGSTVSAPLFEKQMGLFDETYLKEADEYMTQINHHEEGMQYDSNCFHRE